MFTLHLCRKLPLNPRSFCLLLLLLLPAATSAEPAGAAWRSQGQQVYVPAYSRIYLRNGNAVPLAANLSIHNTDRDNAISIISVAYYDSEGKLVERQVEQAQTLKPLATSSFFVKSDDLRGGEGANFLVSWRAARAVSQPVIEAVLVGTFGNRAFSFVSTGRAIGQP